MLFKLKANNLFVLFFIAIISFTACSNGITSDPKNQLDPEQILLSSSISNVNESTNFIEFEVSFLNFSTIPSTVDIYIGNGTFVSNVFVEGNKIKVDVSYLEIGTNIIYVKSGNISSNQISITKEGHKYISIRLGKATNSEEDISSYNSSDFLCDDEIENKNAGVAKGYYYGLQLMCINFGSVNLSLSMEGNYSSDTKIMESVYNSSYGTFYPLFIAPDETAEKITIIASYDETIKGTLTLELYNKFNRDSFSSDFSFGEKTFLTEDDVFYIRDTISINKSIDYNLDFTNCRFEFDTIPYCAFCKINPFTSYYWDILIERYGTPDILLEEDGALVNLKSIILPDSIKEIDRNAFAYCFNMKLEQLPESLEKIWFDAFLYCKSITINKIPDTVTFLESDAFARCNGITSIQLPNNIKYFNTSVFDNCENISEIKIPASVQRISNGYGATYFDFDVDNNNNYFSAIDGILYSRDGKTLYRIPISKVGTSYTIPASVTKIAENALCYLLDLTTLYIPSSVIEMERDAIVTCRNLKNIYIDFSEKPKGWDDNWLWNTDDKTINFIGASNGNTDEENNLEDSLSGIYTIKDNTIAQLNFSDGILEFIYKGNTRNTYSYEISNSILTVTWDVPEGPFVGQFDIEKTDTGYILKQKDDVAFTWTGTWTHAASTEKVELYR